MSNHARIYAFGGAALFVVAGIACAIGIAGFLGSLLALILIASGLVLATSLAFLEVGLSEDRDRAREYDRRVRESSRGRLLGVRSRRRVARERAHRRRLP